MKTPEELRNDVLDELEFEPSIEEAAIGVAVSGDVVTLTGTVRSYAQKMAAERAARRVHGVHGIANDVLVDLWPGFRHDDPEIARAAVNALRWNTWLPEGAVTVTVKDGWITLDGTMPWQYQKLEAEQTVQHLRGVKGVTNQVVVKPRVQATQVERRIQSAFQRSASLDARGVLVETSGSVVILRGTVRSWPERDDAERAAWSIPGVTGVRNELSIVAAELAEV